METKKEHAVGLSFQIPVPLLREFKEKIRIVLPPFPGILVFPEHLIKKLLDPAISESVHREFDVVLVPKQHKR